jgi:7,8-dihydroneopterin aldolase/epimerase/oxygenase
VTDRIVLANMQFEGTHGVLAEEHQAPQPFEVDVELHLDLAPAGRTDDLSKTADYRQAFEICRDTIEGPTCRLIETLAERIAARLLAAYQPVGVTEVVVRIRKPAVMLPGVLDSAAVEIARRAGR